MIGLSLYRLKLSTNFNYLKMEVVKKIERKQKYLLKEDGKKITKKKVVELPIS